jgi:hypothetical protein
MESSSYDDNDTIQSRPLQLSAMGLSADPFEKLAEGLELYPFTGVQSLRKRLNDRRDALQKDTTRDQFLVFSNVPVSIASNMSDDSCRVSKFARLSYNVTTQTLIVKIMPSPEHEAASRAFYDCIRDEILAMNLEDEVEPLGSTTVQIGIWKKEADECWAPSARNTQLSAIFEVGLSESSRRLSLDARGWLETSGSSVKVVITLKIDRNIPQITIKRWELCAQQYSIATRASPVSASCTDEISITRQNNTTTVAGDLSLPFQKVVGRAVDPNNILERDFLIPRQSLQRLAERVWRKQGFI